MVKELVKDLWKVYTDSCSQGSTTAIKNFAINLGNILLLYVFAISNHVKQPKIWWFCRNINLDLTYVLDNCRYDQKASSRGNWPSGTKAQEAWERFEQSFSENPRQNISVRRNSYIYTIEGHFCWHSRHLEVLRVVLRVRVIFSAANFPYSHESKKWV